MLILIADDERFIRLALKSMIEELNPNMHTFIDARNGQELINITKTNTPNLAFVDINMPLIDGLSAISLCKDRSLNTQWFILTGETEFHFAKKSISLGVSDYLLKPISLADLKPILINAQSKIYDDFIKENSNFSLSILYAMNLLSSSTNLSKSKLFPLAKAHEDYKCYLFMFDVLDNVLKKNILEESLEKIRFFMTNLLVNNINFALPYIYNDCIVLIVKSNINLNIHFNNLLSNLKCEHHYVTIFESSPCKDLLEVHNALTYQYRYSSIRSLFGLGSIIYINKVIEKFSDNIIDFSKPIVDLCNYYNKKDELLFKDTISHINTSKVCREKFTLIEKSNLKEFLIFYIKFPNDISENLNSFTSNLMLHSLNISNSSTKASNSRLVDEIMDYVNLNYMNDIGVSTIAALYDITPNYLSKIFHNKSGLKFSDYIATIRIQQGKQMLLSDPSLTIKKVSEKVGYYSSRNFTKQFVKILGVYPSDLLK